jgi:hypothetical protein
MMSLKGGSLAATGANPRGTIALLSFTVSTDETVTTGHECSRVCLIAFHALREEIGLTRLHKIAVDENERADVCPCVSKRRQSG